jgi:hypothetical protein
MATTTNNDYLPEQHKPTDLLVEECVLSAAWTEFLNMLFQRASNAGPLATSQYPSGMWGDRPEFLGPRANEPKFHITLHVSHAVLPTLTSKFRPN